MPGEGVLFPVGCTATLMSSMRCAPRRTPSSAMRCRCAQQQAHPGTRRHRQTRILVNQAAGRPGQRLHGTALGFKSHFLGPS